MGGISVCMSPMTYFYHISLSEQCACSTSLLHVVGEFVIVAWICDLFFLHIHKAEPTNKGASKTNIHNAMEKE